MVTDGHGPWQRRTSPPARGQVPHTPCHTVGPDAGPRNPTGRPGLGGGRWRRHHGRGPPSRSALVTLTIRLLGPPSIERDGRPAPPPRGRKAWALLAYLLLADRPPGRR